MGESAKTVGENRYAAEWRIGFVPLLDCAPLVVAKEFGIFDKHGLRVSLVRQPGWASVRDQLVSGELDASHAVSALAFATTFGLGCAGVPCVTGLMLNTHGDGITLSKRLTDRGIRSGAAIAEGLRSGEVAAPLVFGVVHPYSSHNFILRAWLAAAGIASGQEVRIVTVPPPLMGRNLAAGNLDGYCVGEPWNTASIDAGFGDCIATSAEMCPLHPEKVMLVRRDLASQRRDEHVALIRALLEACEFCDDEANAGELADLLSGTAYVNLPAKLLRQSLDASLVTASLGRRPGRKMNLFYGEEVNRPSSAKAHWILSQMAACGLAPERGGSGGEEPADLFLADLYDMAVEGQRAGVT